MNKGWKVGLAAVCGVVVLGTAWWLGSPLFRNRMVHENAPMMGMKGDMMKPGTSDGMMKEAPMYTGAFMDGDSLHHAMGKVSVISDGAMQYVRFEQFQVTNGPDLFVVLVKPGTAAKDGLRLGALKGNQGDQNYAVPDGTDLMQYSQVQVWCRTFNVTFGSADLHGGM